MTWLIRYIEIGRLSITRSDGSCITVFLHPLDGTGWVISSTPSTSFDRSVRRPEEVIPVLQEALLSLP